LRSIRRQTWTDFECLCVDDGSSDAGPDIIRAHAREDPRLRLLRSPARGIVAALNWGLHQARAALAARMDADDLMHPERLARQHAAMAADPGISVLGTCVRVFPQTQITDGFRAYVDWQNSCVTEPAIAADIFLESPLAHPSVMLRRERIIGAGGYRDGAFPEDYELWLRLHRSGHRLAKLKQPLLDWRDEPGRLSRRDPRYARSPTGALLCGKPWRPRVRRPRALTHGLPQGQRLPARWLRRCGRQQCLDTL
jgi:glycosyltransferase involved in cell wall biosynthesis